MTFLLDANVLIALTLQEHEHHQRLGHDSCEFWADDIRYAQVEMSDVLGHRQVPGVYLAALAAVHGGLLATFDE